MNNAATMRNCAMELEKPVVVAEHTRKTKRTHDEMVGNLPVKEVLQQVEDRTCDKCGSELKTVGREFIRLIFVPARLFVRKHYAEVVKCTRCGRMKFGI
jgi:hypothetical protein